VGWSPSSPAGANPSKRWADGVAWVTPSLPAG